jgi:Lrp/AsnC family transcriptional regulator, leucine-responsive regulatory protein
MLDDTDQRIITALAANARIPLKELARHSALSPPSTSERLRRLEERGVITAFTIDLAPKALGYELQAIIRLRPLPGMLHALERLIQDTPEFVECDRITGEDCFIGRVYARSMDHLDAILEALSGKAETNTSVVKSQPVKRRLPPLG